MEDSKLKNQDNSIFEDNKNIVNVINNWTPENIQLLMNWKITLSRLGFICQKTMEIYKLLLDWALIISLILSSIATILAGISSMALTVDNSTYSLIGFILNLIIFVISTLVSFLNAIIKLFNLNDKISFYASFILKVDQLYTIIACQLMLPSQEREDASIFIKRENKTLSDLIGQGPEINSFLYNNALKKYKKFLEDDKESFICAQKYNDNNYIEIV